MKINLAIPLFLITSYLMVLDFPYTRIENSDIGKSFTQEKSRERADQEAPDFSLKDLDGTTVSLNELKGKVVILDFWATWCGPCIQSFPSMQVAIDKYKNDPDVVFLFINTWEQRQDPRPLVQKFMERKGYDFKVLFDLKNSDAEKELVVDKYRVQGIPAKFIIDGEGKIRYRLLGFAGGDQAEIDELVAMIEEVKGD